MANSQQSTGGTDDLPPSGPPWPSSSPDALSLYGITRRHCRERILVDPLHWTNRHLELLRISFSEPSLAPPPSIPVYVGERAGLTHIQEYYENYHETSKRIDCVHQLIEGEGKETPFDILPRYESPILLREISTISVHCDALFPRYMYERLHNYPVAVYIDREALHTLREESLHLSKCSTGNLPVQALKRHRLKNINPVNPLKDPYIAALMIAIAQSWRDNVRYEKPEIMPLLTAYPSYVLTSFESTECMHLFKADLPSSLLDMFEYPTVAPPTSLPITIHVFTIPFEPALTFRDRLFSLIPPFPDHFDRNKRKRTND